MVVDVYQIGADGKEKVFTPFDKYYYGIRGGSFPAEIWLRYMKKVTAGMEVEKFAKPSYVPKRADGNGCAPMKKKTATPTPTRTTGTSELTTSSADDDDDHKHPSPDPSDQDEPDPLAYPIQPPIPSIEVPSNGPANRNGGRNGYGGQQRGNDGQGGYGGYGGYGGCGVVEG